MTVALVFAGHPTRDEGVDSAPNVGSVIQLAELDHEAQLVEIGRDSTLDHIGAERLLFQTVVFNGVVTHNNMKALAVHAAEEQARRAELAEAREQSASVHGSTSSNTNDTVVTYSDGGSVWTSLAACESGGNWAANTGNSYYGGLQMDMDFWDSYYHQLEGEPYYARPDLAPPSIQIRTAVNAVNSGRGYYPWPTCAARLGLI